MKNVNYYFENKDLPQETVEQAIEIASKVDIMLHKPSFIKPSKYPVYLSDNDFGEKTFVFTVDYEFKGDTRLDVMLAYNKLVIYFLKDLGMTIVPDLDSTTEKPILDCYF